MLRPEQLVVQAVVQRRLTNRFQRGKGYMILLKNIFAYRCNTKLTVLSLEQNCD